jgi:phage-related protein
MELFKLFGKIAIDNTEAEQSLDKTASKAKDSADETNSAFSKIGGVAKKVAVGIGAAGTAIGGAFIGAVEGTREYRVEMAKLDTAFVTNGHSSEVAKKTYSDLNAVLGDSGQAVEASNHLALLTDNEKDLGTWTDICTGIYATFGDSLPIEGLTEAANETAKVGQVTGPLADALNWAGISEDSFNEKLEKCSNEQERQKLIMETLNGVYKDASKQYQETNKDVIEAEKANERLQDALAKVGAVGEPVMTAIKNAIAGMAEKAVPVIADLIKKIQDFSVWIKDNEEKVKMWSGLIAIAMVTASGFVLVLTWSNIMNKAASALNVVTVAVKALNVAMRANIIGLVVTAILALVAAFIYLWNNCESFRNFWINLWKIISNAAKEAWTAIKKAFSGIGKWFSEKFDQVQKAGKKAMNDVKKWFSDGWNNVKKAWSGAVKFFKGIWSGIKSAFSSVKSWFTNIFKSAWNGAKKSWNGAKSFFSGIWSGIKGVFKTVASWFGNTFRSAWNKIKSVWNGARSFFQTVKSWITKPFSSAKTFITDTFSKIYTTIKDKINSAKDSVQKAVDKIKGFFKFKWSLPKLKVPSFSIKGKFSLKDMSVPKISLKWNAEGGILTDATIFGMSGNTLLGGGEAGNEAIVPIDLLMDYIRQANNESNAAIIEMQSRMISRIIELLEEILGMKICLDSGVLVGELTPAIDARLGKIYSKANRGNTR